MQPEETKFSTQRDASRAWGDDAIQELKRFYKPIVYYIVQSVGQQVKKRRVTILYAVPDIGMHSNGVLGTFKLTINDSKPVSASFMFEGNTQTAISAKMRSHIESLKNSTKDGVWASVYPDKPETLMIKQIEIRNVSSTLVQPRPIGLFISGIDNSTRLHKHAVSWDTSREYDAVIMPGQQNTTVYVSGSRASPHLEAILGPENCAAKVSLIHDTWGPLIDSKEKCRKLDITGGRYIFIMYHMVDLIKHYIREVVGNKLPQSITEESWIALQTFHQQWKEAKENNVDEKGNPRPIPVDIYHRDSVLTDDYIGHVIAALGNPNVIAWSIAPEEKYYRVPDSFIPIAAKYFEQTVAPITMTNFDNVAVTAEYVDRTDPILRMAGEQDRKGDSVYFTVGASTFVPERFAIIEDIVE